MLAEADLDVHLPPVTDDEWENWFMDQEMNDRGVYADLDAVHDFLDLIEKRKAELAARCIEVTGFKPTQSGEIANWVRNNGWPKLENLQADTVAYIIEKEPTCPENVKEILQIFSTYGMKAVAKFKTILSAVCKDGRLHGMFVFYGASTTGRWSSKIVQLQNLFRPVIEDCDLAFDCVKERDLDWVKAMFPEEPMRVFARGTRGRRPLR
jgi:DNA polymerase